jgi:uncharacterized protein YjlB
MTHNDPSARFAGLLQVPQLIAQVLDDDGIYPNNAGLPLLVYQAAVRLPQADPAATFETLFAANGWGGAWRDGVYGFHHYHSTAHEVLGVYRGSARVQLGGEEGLVFEVHPGDVVVIPAGVAHKNLGGLAAARAFGVVGAYPRGQRPDMNYGRAGERPRADHDIAQVALPAADPVYGTQGPLVEHWSPEAGS